MFAPRPFRLILPALLLLWLPAASRAAGAPRHGTEPSPLDVVRRYADAMLEHGRDTYGPRKSGLFLSAMDRTTMAPLKSRPAPPDGVRREDRVGPPWSALVGANPQHDQNLLRVLYALTGITKDPKYARAADEELTWFFSHCLSEKTSLLPWGEHMSWEVIEDRPVAGGNDAVHEFARPWVLWDRCFELAPEQSARFATGLWEHQIANHKTGGFDRHAQYFRHGPADGKDFPRHAGFYILTWAHAYKHTKDPTHLRAIEVLLSRFERKRVQKDGTRVVTIGPLDCESAAALVPAEPLGGRLRAFADAEDDLVLADLRKLLAADPRAADGPHLWRTGYAQGTLASSAMLCLARYEQVRKPPYREVLIAIADRYVDSSPEEDLDVWPMAFAHAISTQAAAHRMTRNPEHRAAARRLAGMAIRQFWQDHALPRASLRTGHYETITGADSLALALLEVHALDHESGVPLPSNTIDR